jgi:hypothetical protein
MRVEETEGGKHLMKVLTGAGLALLFALVRPPIANVAEIQPLAILSASIGGERETGEPDGHGVGRGGPRGTLNFLGTVPFAIPGFGLQGTAQYNGGQGSRFGASLGPIYDFGVGKTGFFFAYQHRTLRDADFFWLNPALSLYFDQMNVNISYIHGISPWQESRCGDRCNGRLEDTKNFDVATNRLQGTVSYFPPMDIAFLRKDNVELTFGVQVNTFAGGGAHFAKGAGVGPVLGVSVMPWQNLEVNLFRVTADNRSRFQFNSGVSYFMGRGATLKEWRRQYVDAGPGPVGGFTRPMHD